MRWLIGLVMTATPAFADDVADQIAKKAGACWAIPAGIETPPSALFDVVIGSDGKVSDITIVEYAPAGDVGKQVVLSASRAIETCGPYSAPSGTVRVLMNASTAFSDEKPIDPFKK